MLYNIMIEIIPSNRFFFFREKQELVYFYLKECKPCNILQGEIDSIIDKYDCKIYKYDINDPDNRKLFDSMNLRTVPVILDNDYLQMRNIDQLLLHLDKPFENNIDF